MTRPSSFGEEAAGHAASAPLIVARDPWLRDRVLLLCAAAGVDAAVVDDLDRARGRWQTAACVVLDAATVEPAPGGGPAWGPRRDDVAVVAATVDSSTWQRAVAVGAEQVCELPADEDRMRAWLADRLEGGQRSLLVALTGASGGAGASTVAAALAATAASRGTTCLVDADPFGGGVDLLLRDGPVEGVRWTDVVATEGRISGHGLRDALPKVAGVAVLTWSRGQASSVPAATMQSVLAAGRRVFAIVVVDLPRTVDEAAHQVLAAADVVLLVSTDDVRAVAAASARLPTLTDRTPCLGLVVRTTALAAAPPEQVAESLGVPLVGILPTRRSVARRISDGAGPPRRGAYARHCRDLLDAARLLHTSQSQRGSGRSAPLAPVGNPGDRVSAR